MAIVIGSHDHQTHRGVSQRVGGADLSSRCQGRARSVSNTRQPAPTNLVFSGVRVRWSSPTPLVQAGKQSPSGFVQTFKRLLRWCAHDKHKTTGAQACSPQIKGSWSP